MDRGFGRLIGRRSKRHGTTLAVAGGVDHHAHRLLGPPVRDPVREMLDRVDRLTVVPDQEPQIVAQELAGDDPVLLGDPHLGLDADSSGDLLEEIAHARRRRAHPCLAAHG